MNQELNAFLREGEQPLWHGTPEPFPLLNDTSKKGLILRWVLSVGFSVSLLAAYCAANEEKSVVFIALVVACALALCFAPLRERKLILKQEYWITTQRVIQYAGKGNFHFIELADVDEYRVISGLSLQDSLVIGSCLFPDVLKRLRWQANNPKAGTNPAGTGQVVGMVLYGTAGLDEAVSLLEQSCQPCSKAS